MATDLRGYSADEVLNKVLNTSNDSIQVDIVAGAEYAEDSEHTSTDTGNFVLGVRNDTLAELGGDDGDYVPFQMNADGALYVEISSGGANDSIYVDDADWTDSTSKHTLVGGLYQSSPQSITDGDTGPLQVNANGNLIVDLSATDNAVLDAMVVDLAALETLQTSTNTKLDTLETTLTAIETDQAAIETLLTAANVDHAANEVLLGTIDADTNDIKTAVQIIDNAVHIDDAAFTLGTHSGMMMMGFAGAQSVNSNDAAALACTTAGALHVNILAQTADLTIADGGNSITVDGTVTANLSAIDNAVLDTIDAVLDTIKTDTGTIDADTDAIKTATESSNTHLGNMFYDTALAVTPSDGSDLTGEPFFAVYVGTGGDLKVDMADGGSPVTLANVASGQLLPIMVERIYATGTGASNIIVFK
jgi:hypothetical protein